MQTHSLKANAPFEEQKLSFFLGVAHSDAHGQTDSYITTQSRCGSRRVRQQP